MPEGDQFPEGANRLKDVGESAVNTVMDRVGRGIAKVQEKSPLAYDLLESEDAYLVVFDAPGAERSDVQVRFNEGAVEIRIDRFRDFHEGFEMRFPGRGLALDGRAKLPAEAAVDPEGATSTLTEQGTLRVRVPKTKGSTVAVTDGEEEEPEAEDDPVTLDLSDDEEDGNEDAADAESDTAEDADTDEA
ncbi:Hsp20/alpha crystallin family protein [Halobaculum limi]|uniref:Hsp20/alpha crystallin family protein n=1 Tax=Halobaculum limi TaxID=3031916 RepID=UPI0024070301|nr:Hsp20 family protein [Halobaculum sp. YSMS11]